MHSALKGKRCQEQSYLLQRLQKFLGSSCCGVICLGKEAGDTLKPSMWHPSHFPFQIPRSAHEWRPTFLTSMPKCPECHSDPLSLRDLLYFLLPALFAAVLPVLSPIGHMSRREAAHATCATCFSGCLCLL